jgi:hypothetical protein
MFMFFSSFLKRDEAVDPTNWIGNRCDLDVFVDEEISLSAATRDSDGNATVDDCFLALLSVEVSPTLDEVGAIGHREHKVSNGSNAGHDMSFRLLVGFIPHQQVYSTTVERKKIQQNTFI